jgi:TetR/AcrR family transcriptional regulator
MQGMATGMTPSRRGDAEATPERRRRAAPGFNAKRILDVAFREFALKGLAGARVDEIARRAGVNKQLLYYYYKNKEGLYTAVLAEMASYTGTAVEQIRESAAREGYSSALIDHATPKKRKQWQLWRRLWSWEALERSPTTIVLEEERRDAWRQTVDLAREAQQRGEIDDRFDAEMLMLAIEGILNYPHVLPQNTKLITGSLPMDDEFIERQLEFLRQFFDFLSPRQDGKKNAKSASSARPS